MARGLVDRVGGLRQAIERARELGDLAEHAPIIDLPKEDPTLFEQVLKMAGVPGVKSQTAWVPPPLISASASVDMNWTAPANIQLLDPNGTSTPMIAANAMSFLFST